MAIEDGGDGQLGFARRELLAEHCILVDERVGATLGRRRALDPHHSQARRVSVSRSQSYYRVLGLWKALARLSNKIERRPEARPTLTTMQRQRNVITGNMHAAGGRSNNHARSAQYRTVSDPFLAQLERTERYDAAGASRPGASISKMEALRRAQLHDPITLENWAERSKKVGMLHIQNEAFEKQRIASATMAREAVAPAADMQRRNLQGQGAALDQHMMELQQQQSMATQQRPAKMPPQQQAANFLPSARFQGARAGFVFKSGESGTGYYRDPRQASAPDTAFHPSTKVMAPPGGASSIVFGGGAGTQGDHLNMAKARQQAQRYGSPARMQTGNAMPAAGGGRARSAQERIFSSGPIF